MCAKFNPRIAIAVLLLGYIGTMAAINVWTKDRSFSDSENRVLAQRPTLSANTLLNGRFTREYASYTADQFALREGWIGIKTDTDRLVGKKESNGVFLGKEGFLLERYESPAENDMQRRAEALQRFDEAVPRARKHVLIAPTAASLLANKLPPFAPVGDQRADLNRFYELLPESVNPVDVRNALIEGSEGEDLFYRTDHHWTTDAAYSAYRELIGSMGFAPQSEEAFEIREAGEDFYGSLASKSGFRRLRPDVVKLYIPKREARMTVRYAEEGLTVHSLYAEERLADKDKYAVFLNGNHPRISIETEGPEQKSLLIVKDSFANSLIPFLTGHFSRIDVIDLRYYDEPLAELARERNYEDVLFLYNAKTFFEDSSILNITEGIQ